ncbi:GrpB family protein [Bacillus sp. H-16]|uniref:GrpB family protein n=1 Tax=Alteribacter salitolerans TaxID=2912333 RepID=UPI0019665122|nr:GrpB family protein [Alteribacter salitolerans]MBM7095130.1 GrpB family protein [Alteribacter salitolerans]
MENKHGKSEWPAWATETVEIAEPDARWLKKGSEEKERLTGLLSPLGVLQVEHIGSTSIPHLPAKPIIDLMGKVHSFDAIEDILSLLEPENWHYVPPHLDNRPWRRFFVKVKNNKRVAHLHLIREGDQRWTNQIQFRDRLIVDGELAKEYGELKVKLSQQYADDREKYTDAKGAFVARVLS